MKANLLFVLSIFFFASCSPSKNIAKSAKQNVIRDSAFLNAHVGISIYEPATGKYLYNYQGDKYFVPASNTKIPTCYAAMKYLGDSLVGLKYGFSESERFKILAIQPTGDPTFLHASFRSQPVWNFLSAKAGEYKESIAILDTIWQDERWGSGWSWNDYDASYMAERNSMPIFGNVLKIELRKLSERFQDSSLTRPAYNTFKTQSHFFDSLINSDFDLRPNYVHWNNETVLSNDLYFRITRDMDANRFQFGPSKTKFLETEIPFVTSNSWKISYFTTANVLADTLKFRFGSLSPRGDDTSFTYLCHDCIARKIVIKKWYQIHSQPTDSLLKPMMHRSDNFFAEQLLLMVSNEKLGVMNDTKIIDTILKTDFRDLPQKPRWADGSGLSRYNLFTPRHMVAILNKMQSEFGMERIRDIFPTGGEGTLNNYYGSMKDFIFAKTGTLTGVVALSGFLYTKKNKLLIFSVLVNNHRSSPTDVRRAIEKFIQQLRDEY